MRTDNVVRIDQTTAWKQRQTHTLHLDSVKGLSGVRVRCTCGEVWLGVSTAAEVFNLAAEHCEPLS